MPDFTYDVGRVSFVMKGAWNLATAYEKLDAVTHDGSLYIAKQDVPGGTAITNTTYWQLAAEKGDQGPTGGVDSVNGRTGAVTGLAEEDALGGTLRNLLAVSKSISFSNTAWVDLGTLTWGYSAGLQIFYVSDVFLPDLVTGSNLTNLICSKYPLQVGNLTNYDKVFNSRPTFYGANLAVVVKDSTYSNAAAFKTAMKGVLLAYEKA